MTREEAIKILSPNSESRLVRAADGFLPTQKVLCALEMAVSALRAQQAAADAVENMCCDCTYGGLCCDYSENESCEHRREDGACWTPYRPAKLDRSQWEGCRGCELCKNDYKDGMGWDGMG